jgi:hypothetical protein
MGPRGCWTYGARHQHRFPGEPQRRSLVVFRNGSVFGTLDGTTQIFRRDFDATGLAQFNGKWITGWDASKISKDGGAPYHSHRVAEESLWRTNHFIAASDMGAVVKPGTQLHNDIHALALAGDGRLFAMHKDGRLKAINADDGSVVEEIQISQPTWDGLAIAGGRLYLSTQDGELACVGEAVR